MAKASRLVEKCKQAPNYRKFQRQLPSPSGPHQLRDYEDTQSAASVILKAFFGSGRKLAGATKKESPSPTRTAGAGPMAKRYPRDPAYPKPPRWGLLYDKYFPEHTDGASRHTKCIAESMRNPLSPLRALMVEAQYEPDHWASSMEVTVKMLWEARAELAKLKAKETP